MYSSASGSVLDNSRCLHELPYIGLESQQACVACSVGVQVVHGETALLGKVPACSRLIS